MLASRKETGDNPDAEMARNSFIRSLGRPEQRKWASGFLKSTGIFDVSSPRGIYLGRGRGYTVDLGRLERVISRILRGLYAHHFSEILSPEAEVIAYAEEGLIGIDRDRQRIVDSLVRPLASTPAHRIGDGRSFKYWFQKAPEMEEATAWVLTFYESTRFLAITLPEGAVRSRRLGSAAEQD